MSESLRKIIKCKFKDESEDCPQCGSVTYINLGVKGSVEKFVKTLDFFYTKQVRDINKIIMLKSIRPTFWMLFVTFAFYSILDCYLHTGEITLMILTCFYGFMYAILMLMHMFVPKILEKRALKKEIESMTKGVTNV